DAPLVVDANAPASLPVTLEHFQAIVWRDTQIVDSSGLVEHCELAHGHGFNIEFVSMAQEHGVAHVGDADPHIEMSATYGQNVQLNHSLVALGQPREMRQQYLDFAVGRNFRKSLIVHQERAEKIEVTPDLERMADMRWAGHF